MLISTIFDQIGNLDNINKLIEHFSDQVPTDAFVHNQHYPYELEKRYYEAILKNQDDEIICYGRMISKFQISKLCEGNEVRSYKNNLIGSCAVMIRYAMNAGVEEAIAFALSDKYVNLVENTNTIKELSIICDLMHLDIISEMKKAQRPVQYSQPVNKAIHFINQQVEEKISLKDVAAALKLNDKYLSRLFSKETGIKITDFINKQKTSRAKYLFCYTKLSVLEVAIQLGFQSQDYFSKVFKSLEGVTPRQYRANLRG